MTGFFLVWCWADSKQHQTRPNRQFWWVPVYNQSWLQCRSWAQHRSSKPDNDDRLSKIPKWLFNGRRRKRLGETFASRVPDRRLALGRGTGELVAQLASGIFPPQYLSRICRESDCQKNGSASAPEIPEAECFGFAFGWCALFFPYWVFWFFLPYFAWLLG